MWMPQHWMVGDTSLFGLGACEMYRHIVAFSKEGVIVMRNVEGE